MFWEGFAAGFAACFVLGIVNRWAGQWLAERRARAAYIASLSPQDRDGLRGWEESRNDWRSYQPSPQGQ